MWKPQAGAQHIRILPTADGDPFREFHFHYNVGKNPESTVTSEMMVANALSVTSHLNFGEKVLKQTIKTSKTKLKSCLLESVTTHQYWFVEMNQKV